MVHLRLPVSIFFLTVLLFFFQSGKKSRSASEQEGGRGVAVGTATGFRDLVHECKGIDSQFAPVKATVFKQSLELALTKDEIKRGRRMTAFHLCSGCTCCSANHKVCIQSACCFSITCGLPDKPFGVCGFTPKSCNCTGCVTS